MQTLTEKRVFGSKFGTTELFVASETGLVEVSVSADQIGEFGLAHRGAIGSVAVDDRGVVIGTDDNVLHSESDTDGDARTPRSRTFSSLGDEPFGHGVAVDWGPGGPVAADTDGVVFEWSNDDGDWHRLGETDGVRAVDGGLLAASDGVYRLAADGLEHVGLSEVRDVAGHGTPLAATADGLFALANGWQHVRDGAFDRVASDGHGHAHAIGSSGVLRRSGEGDSDEEWTTDELPVGSPAVDVAYGSGIVAAITENGTLCVDAGDGWRHQLLGVQGVCGLAIGPGDSGE